MEPGEACDGSALQSATCASLGFSGGSLACSSTCQFNVSACTAGPLTPIVTASRTSCVAPCGVNFDATATTGLSGGDYVGANWSWDFGDPASPHPRAIGHVVGHVFDTAGTYAVKTRVQDLAGNAGTTTTTITVTAMGGTTYYVSRSGSDTDTGTSPAHAFLTVAKGLTKAAANVSILLRNGDTFTAGSATLNFPSKTTGPTLLANYSDPLAPSSAVPIVSSSVPPAGFGSIMGVGSTTDVRIANIHFIATAAAAQGFSISNDTNALLERVEVEGVGVGSNGTINWNLSGTDTNIFIVDSHAHDFGGYGVYADRPVGLSLIGTTIERFNGGDHGIRIQGGDGSGFARNTYIDENFVSPGTASGSSFDACANRGDNTNTVVTWNTFTNTLSFTPQNTMQIEHISQVLAEGNTLSNNTTPASAAESWTGINIIAQHVYVRNNVIYNPGTCVGVTGHPLLPATYVDQIFVYDNTCYVGPAAGISTGDSFTFLALDSVAKATGTVTIRNNLWWMGSTNTNSKFVGSGGETIVQDHNLGYAPNVAGTWSAAPKGTGTVLANPLFVSTTLGAATAFRLQSGSPARNAGASVPVYQDQASVTRGTPDIGAYEYTP